MPLRFSDQTTATGTVYLRIDAEGVVEEQDALALVARLETLRGGKVLSVTASNTEFRPAARRVFLQIDAAEFSAIAAVVASPVVQAATNLILRFKRDSSVQVFRSLDEALAWLEAQGP